MSIRDRNISTKAAVGLKLVELRLTTSATGQTALLADAVTPGFAFTVVKASVFAQTVTATISADVQIAGASCLASAITPTAATEVAGTISATYTSTQGGSTDQLQLKYTSNGSGAATGLVARVWIKPTGMDGDPKIKG